MTTRQRPARRFKLIHSLDEIPEFASEDEEHRFWSTHELADELWDQAEPLPEDVEQALERARQARRAP